MQTTEGIQIILSPVKGTTNLVWGLDQGRNEVYFFIADPVFLRKFLIPDPKSDENFDP